MEAVLVAQPGVTSATVTGEPDDEWGTKIIAELHIDGEVNVEELRIAVGDALGPHAVTKTFRIVATVRDDRT